MLLHVEALDLEDPEVAAGVGITYEELTGDLSGVNYSSIRFGLNAQNADMRALRDQVFVPSFCQPIWSRWVDTAIAAGELPDADYPVEWQHAHEPYIDRAKEEEGVAKGLANGTTSIQREIRRKGEDPHAIAKERAEDAEMGLVATPEKPGPNPAAAPPADDTSQDETDGATDDDSDA